MSAPQPTPDPGGDATASDWVVDMAGGRRVGYKSFGAPDGLPLIALHGTPGSRHKFLVADRVARSLGVRFFAPDRWGYGGTDAHPSPSLAAFADDLAAFADRLGLERFALMGVSGGGPYAAATAARHPGRVSALALVAPVGPIAGETDPELSPLHRFCFGPLARRPAAVATVFAGLRAALAISPAFAIRLAMIRSAPADRRVLGEHAVAERLAHTMIEGLRPGVAGPGTDMRLFGRPWDVDLDAVRAPSRLWLGSADQNVPRSAARRLAARIPGCDVVDLPGEGHLWIARNHATVLDWLAQTQKGGGSATPSHIR